MRVTNPFRILLVEDNPADVRLTEEALRESKLYVDLQVAEDGEQALSMLYGKDDQEAIEKPHLILLDLNLPKVSGREILEQIKQDAQLRLIPVVVLTTSSNDEEILSAYGLSANAYVTKPVDFDKFIDVVKAIEQFWFTVVSLPEAQKVGRASA